MMIFEIFYPSIYPVFIVISLNVIDKGTVISVKRVYTRGQIDRCRYHDKETKISGKKGFSKCNRYDMSRYFRCSYLENLFAISNVKSKKQFLFSDLLNKK